MDHQVIRHGGMAVYSPARFFAARYLSMISSRLIDFLFFTPSSSLFPRSSHGNLMMSCGVSFDLE